MDVLFNLADVPGGESLEPRPPSYVVGTMTRPIEVLRAGTVDLLGIRFRAAGITPFVATPAAELTDGIVALEDIWGGRAREIRERLRACPDTGARIGLIDQLLEAQLHRSSGGDPLVRAATRLAEQADGRVDVTALVDATGLGRRQFERRFLAVVGVPPKTACRVMRFQGALSQLTRAPSTALSRLALDSGYHDQAHFTREFKALAGVTPGAYRQGLLTPP